MKALIKLTLNIGECPIWINPSFIASMTEAKSGASLFVALDSNPIFVKETPEEIISLIQSI